MGARSDVASVGRRVLGLARRRRRTVVDQEPPPCPEGWQVGPPDFVGVGVQRAGTTWWSTELAAHPAVHRAPGVPKEVHFFDGCADRELGPADVERYHGWFPRPEGGVAGEWTPCYAFHPWELPMLARAAPDAHILLLLRDPMARFHSGLRLRLARGWAYRNAVVDAFERGLYAGQVRRLLDHFPRERVLVLAYEEALASPEATRRRTLEFLGLDPERLTTPPRVRRAGGPGAERDDDATPTLRAELRARYAHDTEILAGLLPDLDVGRWSLGEAAVD